MKHFTAIADYSTDELRHLLDVALRLKSELTRTGRNDPVLAGKTLAMIFEKPSLRTRVSFAVAMEHLGGMGLVLRPDEVGLGTREPVQDVARVLSGMCDGIMARVFEHDKLTGLAKWSSSSETFSPATSRSDWPTSISAEPSAWKCRRFCSSEKPGDSLHQSVTCQLPQAVMP